MGEEPRRKGKCYIRVRRCNADNTRAWRSEVAVAYKYVYREKKKYKKKKSSETTNQ